MATTASTHPLSFDSKEERPWQNTPLMHGCIVGHTTTKATKIWVIVHEAATYTLVVHTAPIVGATREGNTWRDAEQRVFTPTAVLDLDINGTTKLTGVFEVDAEKNSELTPLTPGTRYYYGVRVADRWVLGDEEPKSFRTLSEDGDLKFCFYSCHMPFRKKWVTRGIEVAPSLDNWLHLRSTLDRIDADFVIGGGDQAYTDGDDKISIWAFLKKYKDDVLKEKPPMRRDLMLSWYNDIYRGYWGFRDLRRVFGNYPNYMTWDDHEIMDGWGSYESKDLETVLADGIVETKKEKRQNRKLMYEMFDAACKAYHFFQHSHNPDTGISLATLLDRETIRDRKWHYDFVAKGCAFFCMDVRGHKSMDVHAPNYEDEVSLLGKQQLADFEQWLKRDETGEAKAVFIVSAVPFLHWKQYVMDIGEVINPGGTRDDVRDEWDHVKNHTERNRVMDAIFDFSAKHDNKKVFILSGDVHSAACFQFKLAGSEAKVYQLTSSAITYAKLFPSWLIKKQVQTEGHLNKRSDISFKRLSQVETCNNFAAISVADAGEGVKVHFDLYCYAERDEGLMIRDRLTM